MGEEGSRPPVSPGFAVMTHPGRLPAARRLARAVGGEVVVDPLPGAGGSPLRTAALAWGTLASRAGHVVVLQDDVRLAEGFVARVGQAARRYPDAAVAFYANWDTRNGAAVRLGACAGAHFVTAIDNEYTPCLALLLPARHAAGFAAYATAFLEETKADDKVMMRYLRERRVRTLLSVPALVEHEGDVSVAANGIHGLRRAACFLPRPPARGTESRVLTDFPVCPHYRDGLTNVLSARREPAAGRVWDRRPWPGDIGAAPGRPVRHSWAAARAPAEAAASALDAGAPGRGHVRELWATAYRLGETGAGLARERGWTGVAIPGRRDPVVSAALRTLGVGGLLKVVAEDRVLRAAPALHEVAELGFEAGAHAIGSTPARRLEGRRR